jgi:hypothetical protein
VAGEGRLGEETNGNLSWGRSRFFKDRNAIGHRYRLQLINVSATRKVTYCSRRCHAEVIGKIVEELFTAVATTFTHSRVEQNSPKFSVQSAGQCNFRSLHNSVSKTLLFAWRKQKIASCSVSPLLLR